MWREMMFKYKRNVGENNGNQNKNKMRKTMKNEFFLRKLTKNEAEMI